MIKYHPDNAVLKQFAAGELPVSVSVIVSSHVEMCPHCQAKVAQFSKELADSTFAPESAFFNQVAGVEDEQFISMIDSITDLEPDPATDKLPKTVTEIEIAGKRLALPRALKSLGLKEWSGLGKLSRSRLDLDDGDMRMSLLHIEKGGNVPTHTHKGFEITLLLQGSFEDDMGRYQTGDFIWLDGEHTHSPVTEEGCVCLTVSSDALHFTEGVSQLLNPLGKFIY
ncbi:ChrR family anti-sigma-E factor [Vibrio paucivorans]|uniref:ChrR family anti-sigma-E factor n=1 Tax=Vibrio paucivorans TaxID=2829489 RepID=A0A9X3CEF2_9VIBR|nr:ChrR family anti-sigma-E factor [Vibrio paucivorans]MCW8334207.1 ChrR family anti-sigma-E factor [Vibrio paucivorans]